MEFALENLTVFKYFPFSHWSQKSNVITTLDELRFLSRSKWFNRTKFSVNIAASRDHRQRRAMEAAEFVG